MSVLDLPMDEICSDSDFNCRGEIIPFEVAELAKDIKENGLIQPIVVQPYEKNGYKYRIIVGHRRHLAFKVNGSDTIPSIIKEGLDEQHALALNLSENIQRQALNILQEARAVEKFKLRGLTMKQIANLLNTSTGWVQIRFALLKLPHDVQQDAAAGYLSHVQIRDLASLNSREEIYATVRAIKDHKDRGEKMSHIAVKKDNKIKKNQKKVRKPPEIFDMQDLIREAIGNNIGTICLGWCAGMLTNQELLEEVKRIADQDGIDWQIPEYIE